MNGPQWTASCLKVKSSIFALFKNFVLLELILQTKHSEKQSRGCRCNSPSGSVLIKQLTASQLLICSWTADSAGIPVQ